jgi:effector-binding domain-containing protein
VVLKTAPAQSFLAVREVLPDIASVRQLVGSIATTVPAAIGPGAVGPITIVMHGPMFEPDALDFAVGCLLAGKAPEAVRLSKERVLTRQTLPAEETLATLVHTGRVEESHRTFGLLAAWIERNQFQLAGPARELLIQLPDHDDIAVFELQLPVRRLDAEPGR